MGKHPLPDGRVPVLLSAHAQDLIGQDATAILNYLDRTPNVTAVAATMLATRRMRRHRAVVRAADHTELAAGLQALADDDEHPLVSRSSAAAVPRIAFVFAGQGNQWPSMGADAYQQVAVYRAEVDRCVEAFAAAGLWSPLPYLLGAERDLPQIVVQGAQFTHAVALARAWQSCGILPDLCVGHSLGEVAAAYVAGAVALPDAVRAVGARATVVGKLSGRYGMAVLGTGIDEAERLIAETQGWLEVSAVNADSSSVVSGDRDAVAAIVQLAEQQGIFARAIAVDYPGHTSALEPLRDSMKDLLPASAFLDAPVEFIGSARGGVVDPDTDFTDYWCDNLCNTVRFDHAVAAAIQRGAGAFIEMSAHPSLLGALVDLIDDALIVGSGRRDESIVDQLSANIAAIAVADPGYRWADVTGVGGQRALPGFPNAPMKAVHLWATTEPSPPVPGCDLIVAREVWEERNENGADRSGQSLHRVAIVGPGSRSNRVALRLTAAVVAHDGCELVTPDEAEIAVLIAPTVAHPGTSSAVDEIFDAARQLDYHRAVGPRCRRVWLITARGERVGANEPLALPGQAALAAMHRSVGFEFGDRTFAHLDLPSPDTDDQVARACIDALLRADSEVALRYSASGHSETPGLVCYSRTLRECSEPACQRPLDAAALEDVVISGGSGGIGLRYARHCVERGARRIVLLSRNGLDRAGLDQLIEDYPVKVHAPACDITDPGALSAVAAEYGADGASLLIHAAGAARFGAHDQLGDRDWADVFGAKVAGLAHIADLWPLRHRVRILLCSSVSGVWGGYGHAAYAASNRFLCGVADQLRAGGLDCTAVQWGLWPDTGIAEADEISRIERSGVVAMDPDAAISASLCHHDGDPLILAADLTRLRVFFETQGSPMPFERAAPPPEPAPTENGDGGTERSVAEVVRTELAATLSISDAASVDLSAALVDLGVDSLLALDLRKRLRRETGSSVPLARLLGGISGAELIETLQSDPQMPTTTKPERPERVESSRD